VWGRVVEDHLTSLCREAAFHIRQVVATATATVAGLATSALTIPGAATLAHSPRRMLLLKPHPILLHPIPSPSMGLLGKMVHIGIDAVLISTVLSGIKRSTGLT
jgi:hypothetical protein